MSENFRFVHEFVPGTSSRTLLLFHGTGADEQNILPVGRALDPAANLLSPRGKVEQEGRRRFFLRRPDGTFDLDDLKARTDELAEFIVAAAAHYRLERARIIGVGYSNGATICSSLLLQHPGLLRASILFRGMVPLVPSPLPDLRSTSAWLGAGKEDSLVPCVQTEQLAALLRSCGARVTLARIDSDHQLTREDITLAQAWMTAHD